MAQNTNRINKRKVNVAKEKNHHIFLFIFIFLIVVAAVIYCLLFFKPRETKPADDKQSSETSQTEKKSDTSEKSKEETGTTEPKPESEKNNPQYEGQNPNTYSDLTGIINYIGASNGTLNVRVSIEQSASGTCDFTLTSPSGKSVVGSSELTIGPTSAFCSFNTPATESGTWKVSVTAISNDKRGTITGEGKI